MDSNVCDLVVIGGGAAGVFCAINYAEFNPGSRIIILEAGVKPLGKVRVSGGGRCNVTHACFDPNELIQYYPRGNKELLGPFNRFGPAETIEWFSQHNVELKTEADGRMFPISNSSETIINCFIQELEKNKITLNCNSRALSFNLDSDNLWRITTNKQQFKTRNLFVASGSDNRIWQNLSALNHSIINPVPSLFTFNVVEKDITSLQGIAIKNVLLKIVDTKLNSEGPLLITHWGLSGPAVLKLSAWGARELHDKNYSFKLSVNWTGMEHNNIQESLILCTKNSAKKLVCNLSPLDLPSRLWKFLCERAEINNNLQWINMSTTDFNKLSKVLTEDNYSIHGKSTFKEEFVTAGGIELKEINFKKFESKILPGLYLAGEVLNIDALTGGYNFQAAWTGAYLAASSML
ncbi:MAG: NAD(P)/FAD-dependent oxidoreductase [Saprospiraceae bacterium]